MNEDTFKPRTGTKNEGGKYEIYMTALLGFVLTLDKKIENFKISSNDGNFSDFDDVVLKLTKNSDEKILAIQLKHTKQITNRDLQGPQGTNKSKRLNFYVGKYFEAYKEIVKNNPDIPIKCVIYTCATSRISGTFDVCVGKWKHDIEVVKFDNLPLEDFPGCLLKENYYMLKLKNSTWNDPNQTEETSEVENFKIFLKNFVLLVDQYKASGLERTGFQLFENNFGKCGRIYEDYISAINKWYNNNKIKNYLEKSTVLFELQKAALQNFNLKSFPNLYYLGIFKEVCQNTDVTILKSSILDESLQDESIQNVIKNDSRSIPVTVIKCTNEQQEENVKKLLQWWFTYNRESNIKFLLIGKKIEKSDFLENVRIFESFKDLSDNNYKKIVAMGKISLQGRPPRSIHDIVEEDMKVDFTTDVVANILGNENFLVGKCIITDNPEPYIPRTLSLKDKSFKESDILNELSRVNFIYGDLGMGKTTLLNSLKIQVPYDIWMMDINMLDISKEQDFENLLKQTWKNDFDEIVCKSLLRKNVAILFFDNCSTPGLIPLVENLINDFETNCSFIIATNTVEKPKEKFFEIKGLKRTEQIMYLKRSTKTGYMTEENINSVLNLFETIFTIPLHLQNFASYENVNQWIVSDVVHYLIQKCYHRYVTVFQEEDEVFQIYSQLAASIYIPNKNIEICMLPNQFCGIVTHFDESRFKFRCDFFGKYFAAKWLIENQESINGELDKEVNNLLNMMREKIREE